MDATYYQTIANSTAHRKSRDDNKDFIFNHPEYLPDLLQISYNTTDKNHHKACWILELVFEERLALIQPHLSDFCHNLKHYTSDSAIRSLSKICLFLAQSKTIKLTETHKEQIMEALYYLGKRHAWINEELKLLLSREFVNQTPGYRSAVKDLLKRLR